MAMAMAMGEDENVFGDSIKKKKKLHPLILKNLPTIDGNKGANIIQITDTTLK